MKINRKTELIFLFLLLLLGNFVILFYNQDIVLFFYLIGFVTFFFVVLYSFYRLIKFKYKDNDELIFYYDLFIVCYSIATSIIFYIAGR